MAAARDRFEMALGAIVATTLVATLVLVYKTFNGDFGDHMMVGAQIAQVGDSLDDGDIVTYRDVIVGEVASFAPARTGGATLRLQLHSDLARQVPANVTAVAVPANLFGATQILLLPPEAPSAASLRAGQTIPADASPAASGLQTALADAYDLITAVHPAQLDAALTALATAVQGRGADLGRLIRQADDYLRALAPSIPELDETITRFATVTEQVAVHAPALLKTLGNFLVPARGILAKKDAVARLFDVAPATLDNATKLLNATSDNFITVVTNEVPFLRAAAADPGVASQLITGLKHVIDAVNSAVHNGRLRVEAVFSGINFAGILQTYANQPSAVLSGVADPPLYTDADCPRYPGASGPNCGSGGSSSSPASGDVIALSTATTAGNQYSSVGGAEENAVVKTFICGLTGLPRDSVPDGMGAYLGPLLRGAVTVIS
jgi:phospholipid/cholesterol/gamma-HCH transport system substrate-binding protein